MRTHEYDLGNIFGSFLAEGARAAAFRFTNIEPAISAREEVILDFSGVHNINSSFANALISPLIELRGEEVLEHLRFKSCNAIVRVMIEGALSLGVERAHAGRKVPA